MMEPRKQAIMSALDAFVRQRPGLDFRNYGDGPAYRADARSITKDLHDYHVLASYVRGRDEIDADMILAASQSAYSGRLTLAENWHQFTADECPGKPCGDGCDHRQFRGFEIDYCTGQYWPTEYRRAACAVLAAAIWANTREGVPAEGSACYRVKQHGSATDHPMRTEIQYRHGKHWGLAGDWIRRTLRAEFGTPIAKRWFDWDL